MGSYVDITRPELQLSSLVTEIGKAFGPSINSYHVDDFRLEYLISEMPSKFCATTEGNQSLTEAALSRLWQSEEACSAINRNGIVGKAEDCRAVRGFRSYTLSDQWMIQVLGFARERCAEVLGDLTYEWVEDCRLTNGASLGHKRSDAFPVGKLSGDFYVTRGALPYLAAFKALLNPRIFKNAKIKLTPGNRIDTVRKNVKTDRCIAIEPEGNILLQKGLGTWMKRRLKAFGLNLRDQTRNQFMAALLRYATVDLSMASDTVSLRCVLELLPYEWFKVFDDLRSHNGLIGDTWTSWEKFSSMGNGFTFELETLIFHSLVYGVAMTEYGHYNPKDYAVYGDDIICPADLFPSLNHALQKCGFTCNVDKTFYTGPFRESCGKHYYDGVDVTPFYVRKPVDSLPRYIWLANRIRKWCVTGYAIDERLWDLWQLIAAEVPRKFKGGRNLDSSEQLVSPGKPKKRLVIQFSDPRKSKGWRPVGAWLLQSPRQDADLEAWVPYTDRAEEYGRDDALFRAIDWVYSGCVPFYLRGLVSSLLNVDRPVEEVGYAELPDERRNVRSDGHCIDLRFGSPVVLFSKEYHEE